MFGSKKKSEPLQPFSLRVLTAQHVIEGTVAGDTRLGFGDLSPSKSDFVELSSVTITSIDPRQTVPTGCSRFVANTNIAAILVPDADPTRLANWIAHEYLTKPYRGTFYVGPYVVHGTLMGPPEDRPYNTWVGVDLHVSTVLESPDCAQFDAPFALVSRRDLLGWEAE